MKANEAREILDFHARLAKKSSETADLHELIESIIVETVTFLKASSGSIMVYDAENTCLKLFASSRHPRLKASHRGPIAVVSAQEGIAGRVFSTGKPILVSDLAEADPELNLRNSDAEGSFLSVPLKYGKKCIGVMNFNRENTEPGFGDNDLFKLISVDTTIAGLIEKEKLLDTIEENRREISGLYALSCTLSQAENFSSNLNNFLKELSGQLQLKRSAVLQLENPGFGFFGDKLDKDSGFKILASRNLKPEQLRQIFASVSARLQNQLSKSLPDDIGNTDLLQPPLSLAFSEKDKMHELFCIPLMVEGRPSHLLLVSRGYHADDVETTKKHYRFLYLISQNLGLAIERQAMLQRIQDDQLLLLETSTRNEVFLEISKDLASTLDPVVILQRSFEKFIRVIAYTSVAILLFDDLESSYRMIIQPAVPISTGFQKKLLENIVSVLRDYPCQHSISDVSSLKPVIFKPQSAAEKPAAKFLHTLHLPVVIGEKVSGLIHLARSNNEPFAARELEVTSQFIGIFITSIKNAMIHKRTEKLAFTDPLTGLFNHRYFQEQLTHEFIRARRYEKPLSLMVIDIDFFKKFNDTYGHLVGDKVLRHVAGIFSSSIREQIDTVARYGGEEFAVILPETSLEGAKLFAERIRSKVEAAILLDEGRELSVTLSIGVSCTSITDCDKTSDLISAADIALYRAKDAGRNQVQTYEERQLHNGK